MRFKAAYLIWWMLQMPWLDDVPLAIFCDTKAGWGLIRRTRQSWVALCHGLSNRQGTIRRTTLYPAHHAVVVAELTKSKCNDTVVQVVPAQWDDHPNSQMTDEYRSNLGLRCRISCTGSCVWSWSQGQQLSQWVPCAENWRTHWGYVIQCYKLGCLRLNP